MKTKRPAFIYFNPVLLIVWFFIWGICPWSPTASVAQAAETAHAAHGHHGMEETHHASKGTEHSCSGSISYTKSDLGSDRVLNRPGSVEATAITAGGPVRLNLPYFFDATFLPRLLTAYHQLYSVYRI